MPSEMEIKTQWYMHSETLKPSQFYLSTALYLQDALQIILIEEKQTS